jgi:F420-non-reducing hydrogenase iron-sulfur subunit
MRLKYPDTIRIIRVPCTGKVDVLHILRAFEKGADGVYVVGCLEGECRFENGNLKARRRVDQARTVLNAVGVGGDRVKMFNLSSGEGTRFAEYAVEMTEKIRELGPNPIKIAMHRQAA